MAVIKVKAKGDFKVLPIRHLSARVPWHDNKWNGKTCCDVLDNSFCRILPLVDKEKKPGREPSDELITDTNFPPCLAEKGTFLSPNEYTRDVSHKWKDINPLFSEFRPCKYHHKPFSINAVPFFWMMKSLAEPNYRFDPTDRPHKSVKALEYEVDYKPELEQEIDEKLGFEGNIWVQHPENQKALLDTFFGCLKEQKSLVFFYAKHTPLSEPNERVIVGVARVGRTPGPILEYEFPKNYMGHKSYPWDRCIEHTLRPNGFDGFLMPYHEILAYVLKNNAEIELHDYVAVAPDFAQFSFAAELVEHDTAIDALLNLAESLRKTKALLGKSFEREFAWIDKEISKIWDMRGAFPGMGPVLTAIGLESGNTLAWEIEKSILERDGDLLKINPWQIFEESLTEPQKYFGYRGEKLFTSTVRTKWKNKPENKKQFYRFLSRCQLSNEQASYLLKRFATSFDDVFENPYLLYEKTRHATIGITFQVIDKALFPPEKIRTAFPLSEGILIDDQLDERRVRALSIWVLEDAATQDGHSLLPLDDLLNRLMAKQLDQPFPIDEDTLNAQAESEFFAEAIQLIPRSKENKTIFLKLDRLRESKTIILQRLNQQRIIDRPFGIEKDWLAVINDYAKFKKKVPGESSAQLELEARYEKAMALEVLTNSRFSVLIGPAGSGKTTLLEIFEQQPEIKEGRVLKLAPTGKARVKLGPDAQTIAQFLYPDRYIPLTGFYHPNKIAGKSSGHQNVIVDEASMLTEEQLAALFDALGPIDRLILVGDYRQLPPIGTGRPFFDIIQKLKPEISTSLPLEAEGSFTPLTGPSYAELTKNMRQPKADDTRWDVNLSRCFSDKIEKEDLDIFRQLSTGDLHSQHLRLEKWYASDDFRMVFQRILEEELGLSGDVANAFNRTIGATDDGQYFNCGEAEAKLEDWQILSPVKGYGYGVKEVNKFVQTTYRKQFLNLALGKIRLIAKPKGADNVVYGDKIINLKNSKWEDWQKVEPRERKTTALNYFANGEIGVITGEFKSRKSTYTGEPNVEITFSTQPGYSYVFKAKQLSDEGRYPVELAYAITIHKAQGSGFKKVFLVLPSKGAILSRELLYTALTRQEDKVIILHQGEFRDFIRLASTNASATARRFTDLFYLPDIKQIENKFYDAKYINISERGEPMISKNEVIIANLLNKYDDEIQYAYEDKLRFEDTGRGILPDFTIDNLVTGKRFYWEHLGLMTLKDYRDKWEKKLDAYKKNGFVLHRAALPSDERILIVTEEDPNGGINSEEMNELIKSVILER
jgi:ATP-dependent exoDNAse (exonuclease V) alpha subunit